MFFCSANLSESYFTNRQDRYIIFRNCPALADYFHRLILAVSSVSFVVDGDNNYDMHEDCDVHPFRGKARNFIEREHTNF